ITYFAPIQPILGIAALVLTSIALIWRLKGQVVCSIPRRQRTADTVEATSENIQLLLRIHLSESRDWANWNNRSWIFYGRLAPVACATSWTHYRTVRYIPPLLRSCRTCGPKPWLTPGMKAVRYFICPRVAVMNMWPD